ncbi:hypothetical protein Taro_021654, partial [Colocasia esculenta]|nr:hypothetical protein [Colocasia esculenta]
GSCWRGGRCRRDVLVYADRGDVDVNRSRPVVRIRTRLARSHRPAPYVLMRRLGTAHGLSFVPTDGAKSVEAFACLGQSLVGLHLKEKGRTLMADEDPAKPGTIRGAQ